MSQRETIAEQVFGEALDLPREQRAAFLDGACAGNPALRRMVEDLLEENDRLSGFLSAPAVGSAATAEVAAGTRLAERYRIVETLGSGGMGVVYRARDEKLEREVAIKMLQPGMLTGEEARSRFRREARALAKLNHAHIAAVHDVIEQDGADFIVMEMVAGESVAAKLRAGALPVKEATTIALQVAEALEEAHEHGVIHRDLKPANVMITPKGQAKVLDFGLAKLVGPADATQTLTETTGVMGTPLYMSPEQALGKAADARTDLWSLGAVNYEMLTGQTPFRAESGLGVLQAITTGCAGAVAETAAGDAGGGGADRGAGAGKGSGEALRDGGRNGGGSFCAAGEDERSDSGGGGDAVDAQAANGGRGAGADHGGGSSGGVVALRADGGAAVGAGGSASEDCVVDGRAAGGTGVRGAEAGGERFAGGCASGKDGE